MADLQTDLEQQLLAAKLRQHRTAPQVDASLRGPPADFERLRLRQVVVGREDLARELASQVRDEGRDLADVAREQRLHAGTGEHAVPQGPVSGPLAVGAGVGRGRSAGRPGGHADGFVLVLVEERRPAELDGATRQCIQDELFEGWLAAATCMRRRSTWR